MSHRNKNVAFNTPAESMDPAHRPTRKGSPSRSQTRVLLSSVFGPYARDDEYGSRKINPMELYHNQVTRTQGAFSLRMFHRSWGLMLIQANVESPCTLLDFPSLDRFVQEIRENEYDVVGISAIVPNLPKVRKMCELVRAYQPQAKIVVGGHIANMPDLRLRIDADHCVKGEGVRWFRRFLGEDEERVIRHPKVYSGLATRNVGFTLNEKPGDVAATVIPSVGCPMGCNFCSTSAMFGGKGKHLDFYQTGDQLFEIMCELERDLQIQTFFVMDENFLMHRKRALRLLSLMEENEKPWAMYVFSSANVLRRYSIDQLVRLGVSWIWMGIEGRNSQYTKTRGVDTIELVRELQSHGIRVLGSTIIGLEDHTPENIDEVIEHAVRHRTDFHQFMLYTPIPGTPLHAEMTARGLMKDENEYHVSDIHGQHMLNYRHPNMSDEQAGAFLLRAFDRDFEVNGPSTTRLVKTRLLGLKRYRNHPDERIRRRFEVETRGMATTYSALVGGARLYYRENASLRAEMTDMLKDLGREFGWTSRFFGRIGAYWVLRKIRLEEKRLASGWTYEPPTFYETNASCADKPEAALCQYITPTLTSPSSAAKTRAEEAVKMGA